NKNPNHIPRPRNAFMLFRSAFAAAQKISANIEHDNRHITRIIAHCWNRLSDTEKQIWRDKAAAEKAQHAERYPNYRFSPIGRTKKAKKRKVRRNGVEDVKRCETLADLVMAGKHGLELESAMMMIQQARDSAQSTELDMFSSDGKCGTLFDLDPLPQDSETSDVPPFRSPLLPP
ncbi:high mobility group box domain-containing protein, partial [Boletus coccyginus]